MEEELASWVRRLWEQVQLGRSSSQNAWQESWNPLHTSLEREFLHAEQANSVAAWQQFCRRARQLRLMMFHGDGAETSYYASLGTLTDHIEFHLSEAGPAAAANSVLPQLVEKPVTQAIQQVDMTSATILEEIRNVRDNQRKIKELLEANKSLTEHARPALINIRTGKIELNVGVNDFIEAVNTAYKILKNKKVREQLADTFRQLWHTSRSVLYAARDTLAKAGQPWTSSLSEQEIRRVEPIFATLIRRGDVWVLPAGGQLVDEDIAIDGAVMIEGEVLGGEIRAKSITVAERALVVGSIHADEVIIGGTVRPPDGPWTGEVIVGKTVLLQSGSHVEGGISHLRFTAEQGASFEGKIRRRPG